MVRTINCKYHTEKGNWDKLSPRWHLMRVIKIKRKKKPPILEVCLRCLTPLQRMQIEINGFS